MPDTQHNPTDFLSPCELVDADHLDVQHAARQLAAPDADDTSIALACFEFVRDRISHTIDAGGGPVTASASDALRLRTGFCYSKSHLLAALLRARRVPAGICYQRLAVADHGPPYCLHAFNAVYLKNHGWYRLDPRGNRPGIDARFTPPTERLAFTPSIHNGEYQLPGIFPQPLPIVIEALRTHHDWRSLLADLPDAV